MRKILVVLIVLVLLFVAGYFLNRDKSNPTDQNQIPIPTTNQENVEKEIQDLFAEKYNKPTNELKITITKQDGDFVSGGVKFNNNGSGEGGVWLARKMDDVWEVVFSGNGSIDCNKMRQVYGFPDTILKPNFCD